MEVKNNKKYYKHIFNISGFITIGFLLVALLKGQFFIGILLIYLVVEFFVISEKFIDSISIGSLNINIQYYHFFKKKNLSIMRLNAKVQLKRKILILKAGKYYKNLINLLK